MKFTGERVIPWGMPTGKAHVFAEHLARYAWASEYVANKRVCDLGCGCGYGSLMLSWSARYVIGVDVSRDATDFAVYRMEAPNVSMMCADIEKEPVPIADVYTAFEVLEHLYDPAALVERVHGTLLWSLPVGRSGKFHKHDFDLQAALCLMVNSEFWYQKDTIIVPQARAWFAPDNVLGILEK